MIRPVLIAFLVPVCFAPAWAADVVGSVGAVNPSVTGTAPGIAAETLRVGMPVHAHQRIVSNADGSAQLTFLDRSTLNVGKNCDLVIDEFVYDPAAQSGSMTATVTKGLLRFVGGQISHTSGITINTPVATMGIRGGIASIGFVDGSQTGDRGKGLLVVNSVGTVTIRNKVSEVTLSQSGFAVLVKSDRSPIAAPFRLPDVTARFMQSRLTSRPSQTGGAPAASIAAAVRAPALALTSTTAPAPTPTSTPAQAAASTPVARQAPINGLNYTAVFSAGNNIAHSQAQAKQATQVLEQVVVAASNAQASTLIADGIAPLALINLATQQGNATSTGAASAAAVAALVSIAKTPATPSPPRGGGASPPGPPAPVATLIGQILGPAQGKDGPAPSPKGNNGNHNGETKHDKD